MIARLIQRLARRYCGHGERELAEIERRADRAAKRMRKSIRQVNRSGVTRG